METTEIAGQTVDIKDAMEESMDNLCLSLENHFQLIFAILEQADVSLDQKETSFENFATSCQRLLDNHIETFRTEFAMKFLRKGNLMN